MAFSFTISQRSVTAICTEGRRPSHGVRVRGQVFYFYTACYIMLFILLGFGAGVVENFITTTARVGFYLQFLLETIEKDSAPRRTSEG
jgi:hypothetical protein